MLLRRTIAPNASSLGTGAETQQETGGLIIHMGGSMAISLQPVQDSLTTTTCAASTSVVKVRGQVPKSMFGPTGSPTCATASQSIDKKMSSSNNNFFPFIFQGGNRIKKKFGPDDHGGAMWEDLTVEVVPREAKELEGQPRGKDGKSINRLFSEPDSSRWAAHPVEVKKITGAAGKCCHYNYGRYTGGSNAENGFVGHHCAVIVMMLRETFSKDEIEEMTNEALTGDHANFDNFVRDYIPYVFATYRPEHRGGDM